MLSPSTLPDVHTSHRCRAPLPGIDGGFACLDPDVWTCVSYHLCPAPECIHCAHLRGEICASIVHGVLWFHGYGDTLYALPLVSVSVCCACAGF